MEIDRRNAVTLAARAAGALALLSLEACFLPDVHVEYVNTKPIEGLEKRLAKHISKAGGGPIPSYKIFEETKRSTPGAIVGISIADILDNILVSDDRKTGVLVVASVYTAEEIEQVAVKYGVAYIQSDLEGSKLSASIHEKDKQKLERSLRQEFPQSLCIQLQLV